jgi:hypothetical protein
MEFCAKCQQEIKPQDYAIGRRPVGSVGRHVRRYLCACGCKRVELYTVMHAAKLQTSRPYAGAVSSIPTEDFKIFMDLRHVS